LFHFEDAEDGDGCAVEAKRVGTTFRMERRPEEMVSLGGKE
jgi:hypothetical protein